MLEYDTVPQGGGCSFSARSVVGGMPKQKGEKGGGCCSVTQLA